MPRDHERITHPILDNLTSSRPCEICDEPMPTHLWVDLNRHGFAINCSNNSNKKDEDYNGK